MAQTKKLTYKEWMEMRKSSEEHKSFLDSIGDKLTGTLKKKPTENIPMDYKQDRYDWAEDWTDFQFEEGQEICTVEPKSIKNAGVVQLTDLLLRWINNTLADERVLVKDVTEDIHDGQILALLLRHHGISEANDLCVVTGSLAAQRQRVESIIHLIDSMLGLRSADWGKWSAKRVHEKDLVAILHLLVALAYHFNAPIRFPDNVSLNYLILKKENGKVVHQLRNEPITQASFAIGSSGDAQNPIDIILDAHPEKITLISNAMHSFAANNLKDIIAYPKEHPIEKVFADGCLFIFLICVLEDYCVPFYAISLHPNSLDERLANVKLFFQLVDDAGIPRYRVRPEDVVNGDLKSILRLLYSIYVKYRAV